MTPRRRSSAVERASKPVSRRFSSSGSRPEYVDLEARDARDPCVPVERADRADRADRVERAEPGLRFGDAALRPF
jgi:hypothetical protein